MTASEPYLERERRADEEGASLDDLLKAWNDVVDSSIEHLCRTPEESLVEERLVGQARLPSTVLGLLFHAAEHASRHTGQIATTIKILKN